MHGWGEVEITHPHYFVDDSPASAWALASYGLRTSDLKVAAPFGYRGPVRATLLLLARARRLGVVTRSDSSVQLVADRGRLRTSVRRLAMRAAFPRATRVWTVGHENERFWREYVGRHNTRLIPYSTPKLPSGHGLNPAARESDPARLRFLFVGRMDPLKMIDTAIRAFRTLPLDIAQGWRFDIVGDGPHYETLLEQASGDARIAFRGSRTYDNLDQHYSAADVLVLPSQYDNWGLVVNEALAFGCRVLVSERCGAAELVSGHPERGAVLPVGDVSAWAAAMLACRDHLHRVPVAPYDPTADMVADLRSLGGVR